MYNDIMDEIQLANDNRLILINKLGRGPVESDYDISRNVMLLDLNGKMIWRIHSLIDYAGVPFTGIRFRHDGALIAYRWNGGEYFVDLLSGFATPYRLAK
jgi:hypothetical protein